jgi:hypothetical protein
MGTNNKKWLYEIPVSTECKKASVYKIPTYYILFCGRLYDFRSYNTLPEMWWVNMNPKNVDIWSWPIMRFNSDISLEEIKKNSKLLFYSQILTCIHPKSNAHALS